MKFLSLLFMFLSLNTFAASNSKVAFSCNGLTPDGDPLVYYVNAKQMFRVLKGEVGLTGLRTDLDSTTIALADIDEDDLIVVGPGTSFIQVDIRAGRFGVLPFKCYRIDL